MKFSKLALLVLILAGTMFWSGCVAPIIIAGAGVGGYAYQTGKLVFTEGVTVDAAFTAAEMALKDLGLAPEAKQRDWAAARLEAKNAKDQTVRVELVNKGEKITEIHIRVGAFGDEPYSRKIYERIKANL